MESIKTLIDTAVKRCHTKRALASRLGLTEQNLQGVYKGRRHLTPGQAIALAHLCDADPLAVLAEVAIEKEVDPIERGRLQEGFFRRGIAGAVVFCLLFGANPDVSNAAVQLVQVDYLYIVALICACFWLQRFALPRGSRSR